jgi:hypothetical protein
VDPIDDFRSELQRVGESCAELLRPEFQALHSRLDEIATELRRSSRNKFRRRPDPRKEAITRLLQKHPGITNFKLCREMDKHQEQSAACAPPRSWKCRLWSDAYHQVTNRVHSYISAIRRSLR